MYVDGSRNIFIADTYNDRIREVVAATGNIQTVAGNGTYGFSGDGGPAASAELSSPAGVFVDTAGNIFIADSGNLRIREVVAATGNIQTVAGSGSCCGGGDGGPATSAALGVPLAVFGDGSGDIFFAETDAGGHNRIREVVAATGNIQTVAGNGTNGFSGDGGPATSAALGFPTGVFVDRSGNIFIADTTNNRIREVLAATGIIRTVAGNGMPSFSGDGGPATSGGLVDPTGVLVDDAGNIFIADGNRIREVAAASGTIQTVAGNGTCCFSADGGPATSSELAFTYGGGVSVDRSGNIFIADPQDSRIREVVAATGNIRTVAGNGTNGFSGDGGPATSAELDFPIGTFVDPSGNIFTVDGNRVREVDAAAGNIQTVAGNGAFAFSGDGGPATSAGIGPASAYADSAGNIIITDSTNSRVREVVAATGNIQTVAGNGTTSFSGDGGQATHHEPGCDAGPVGDQQQQVALLGAQALVEGRQLGIGWEGLRNLGERSAGPLRILALHANPWRTGSPGKEILSPLALGDVRDRSIPEQALGQEEEGRVEAHGDRDELVDGGSWSSLGWTVDMEGGAAFGAGESPGWVLTVTLGADHRRLRRGAGPPRGFPRSHGWADAARRSGGSQAPCSCRPSTARHPVIALRSSHR